MKRFTAVLKHLRCISFTWIASLRLHVIMNVIVFNIFTAKKGFRRGETKKRQIPFLISN